MGTEVDVFLPTVLQLFLSEVYRKVYLYESGFCTLEEIGARNYFLSEVQLGGHGTDVLSNIETAY